MTIEQLRRAKEGRPFQHFDICIADGQRIRVPHPEFLFIPPRAERTFVVAYGDETYQVVGLLLVTTLDFGNRKPKRRRQA